MADIDQKAQALSDARARILKLQEQMTDRVLQMAAEVEKLMEIIPPAEAKAFLKARCNLPAVELSTYVGFAKTLKGSQGVLRTARASFPIIKALVSADAEARQEVLERMQIGAQIDSKDVAAIRRRLSEAKLTVARERSLPVVIVDRPAPPEGRTVADVAGAVAEVRRLLGPASA
jgi:DNA (cytosine-5)-methyltransferase 1